MGTVYKGTSTKPLPAAPTKGHHRHRRPGVGGAMVDHYWPPLGKSIPPTAGPVPAERWLTTIGRPSKGPSATAGPAAGE